MATGLLVERKSRAATWPFSICLFAETEFPLT